MSHSSSPQRIAIVGAGVSGLVAAHLLHGAGHDVHVFEAEAHAGGHTHTVRVDTAEETHHVDTGFIVYNDRNYPSFVRLLERLGVATQDSRMSFSVSSPEDAFEYSSASLNGLFAQRGNLARPAFHRMLLDVRRFQREARRFIEEGDDHVSLAEFLDRGRYSRHFVERLIVPQVSAVWSADPRQMWSFPVRFLARFLHNHGMLGLRDRPKWRAIEGGSQRYVQELTRPLNGRVRLGTPVRAVRRAGDHVTVTPAGGEAERYDHVLLATHSDQALGLLRDATDREHEVLGAVPYQDNEAVLHTDTALLPRRRPAWSSWNYHLLPEADGRTTLTYWMNNLQRHLGRGTDFCVTLNRTEAIDPEKVLKVVRYAHPVFTPDGVAAQTRYAEIGSGRTHFAGAYWRWGFHEDGVVSALRVCERFGVRL